MNVLDRMRHRTLLGIVLLVVVVACGTVVGIVLMTGAGSQPSAVDQAQIRSQIDKWLSLDDVSWPSSAYAVSQLPASLADSENANETNTLAQVGTADFAASQLKYAMPAVIQELRNNGTVISNNEHQIMSLAYAGAAGTGQLYDVQVWRGGTTALGTTSRSNSSASPRSTMS